MLKAKKIEELDVLAQSMGAVKKADEYYESGKIAKKRSDICSTSYFNQENLEVLTVMHDLVNNDAETSVNATGIADANKRRWGSIAANELKNKEILPAGEDFFRENMRKHTLVQINGNLSVAFDKDEKMLVINGSKDQIDEVKHKYSQKKELISWLGLDLNNIGINLEKDRFEVKSEEDASVKYSISERALIAYAFELDPVIKKNILLSGDTVIKSTLDTSPSDDDKDLSPRTQR